MDFAELKEKNVAELQSIMAEQRALLREYRFKAKANALKQVHLVPIARKIVARVAMLLKDKQKV
jgi:ribosomal protein L29